MSDADIYWTFTTAIQYGGGFYRKLAMAGLSADPGNRQRLLNAFPEMVTTYGTASKLHHQLRSEVAA
jgi:hypothetical protein